MKKFRKLSTNLEFNIVGAIVVLLIVFSWVVSIIGYISFTNSFKREYSKSTYHIARTAATLINGNNIDKYLNEGKDEEYDKTKGYIDAFCEKMQVTLIYVIKVDTEDYKKFKSIFNSIDKNSDYTEWELGFERETTNKEYEKVYKKIYENDLEYGTIYRKTNLKGKEAHITTLVPIKNDNGEVVSILCVQRPIQELMDARKPYLINIAISTVVLSIVAAIIAIIYIRKQFIKPTKKIIEEAKRFAKENTASKRLGNISKIEDIKLLADSINKMEKDMMLYIENIKQITAESEKIGAELSVARTIQENSVPNNFPAFPDRKDFEVYGSMTTAKEVGGDYYDFFLLDDDHLVISIADVSGKGIPAALFMMVTKILISDRTLMGGTPSEILSFVNERICEHNKANMFITVWLGILEISTGKLIAANAGHEKPIICRKNEYFESIQDKRGIVIGAMSGAKYSDYEIILDKNDKIFLFTDGVTEATTINNEMFGMENLLKTLNYYKDRSTEKIIEGVKKSIDKFVGKAPQFDDLTMMCVELKDIMDELIIDAKEENLTKVIEFVNTRIEKLKLNDKQIKEIELCVEEIFVNITHYAYTNQNGKVEIKVVIENDEIKIKFIDNGKKFNPLEKEEPDKKLPASKRKIGGLGIFLVKKYMDDISYNYEKNCNILIITKKIINSLQNKL